MSKIVVKKLAHHPIILVSIDGVFTADDARHSFQETNAIAETLPEPIYRITDVRRMQLSFQDFMEVMKVSTDRTSGGTGVDPRIETIFLGQNALIDVARQMMAQWGKDMPVFYDVFDLLDYLSRKLQDDCFDCLEEIEEVWADPISETE